MKIAVFFPGIGYHCEKPLLYYSGKIAGQYQYEQVRVSYTGLRRLCAEEFEEALEETLQEALAQTESCLKDVDWSRYEDILFISKSIGTAVAAAYAYGMESAAGMFIIRLWRRRLIMRRRPGLYFTGRMTRGRRRKGSGRSVRRITCLYILLATGIILWRYRRTQWETSVY